MLVPVDLKINPTFKKKTPRTYLERTATTGRPGLYKRTDGIQHVMVLSQSQAGKSVLCIGQLDTKHQPTGDVIRLLKNYSVSTSASGGSVDLAAALRQLYT
jgi:hypothetical protein